MNIEELEENDLLLPRESWGSRSLGSAVARWPLVASSVLAVSGLAAIHVGGGGWLTWVGVGGYLIGLAAAVVGFVRSIDRLRQRYAKNG